MFTNLHVFIFNGRAMHLSMYSTGCSGVLHWKHWGMSDYWILLVLWQPIEMNGRGGVVTMRHIVRVLMQHSPSAYQTLWDADSCWDWMEHPVILRDGCSEYKLSAL